MLVFVKKDEESLYQDLPLVNYEKNRMKLENFLKTILARVRTFSNCEQLYCGVDVICI